MIRKQSVIVVLLVGTWMLTQVSHAQQTFSATIESKYGRVVSVNRVYNNSDRHVVRVIKPGEIVEHKTIPFESMQVFLIWDRGNLLGEPVVFDPRRFKAIGLTVDQTGMIAVQVQARD